jgi:cytochrome c553
MIWRYNAAIGHTRVLACIEDKHNLPNRGNEMKKILSFVALGTFSLILTAAFMFDLKIETVRAQTQPAAVQDKIPDVIVLGKDVKLGAVTFNHVNHNGGTYSIDGKGPIACVECHHTAQPAAEIAKHPPLKTAWPADRTTTLTAELFSKDPAAAGVAACRSCHTKAGETPKLLPAIPEIKHESSTAMISLNNQQAFHRNCAGCHTEVKKDRKDLKAPTTTQCMMCHKRTS